MKVTLISYTPNARELLLFTKATRLSQSPALLEEISAWPEERKAAELQYMAATIPSSWEFVDYAFCVEGVSRAYTHQQVRTRAGSYAQQSLRVVDRSDFEFVWPDSAALSAAAHDEIAVVLGAVRGAYFRLVNAGVPIEDARGILPTNIATNIVCKFNLRTLSELAASRSGGRTQREYRTVVRAMCDAVLAVHPWAEPFLFPQPRDYFAEIEAFAERAFAKDSSSRGELLKIVDRMRKR